MAMTSEPWRHPDQARFRLVVVPGALLHALAQGRADDTGTVVTPYLLGEQCAGLWRRRSQQVLELPEEAPWVTRLVFAPDVDGPVGLAGFHGAPDRRGMVEVGYRIDPAMRRRGYATRALETLLAVARDHPEVGVVRASVSPSNVASLVLVRAHGFVVVGEQWDDEDGLEVVYEAPA